MSKRKKYSDKDYGYTCQRSSYESGSLFGISFKDNPEQRELIRLMNQNDKPIIFCFGDAGTGKTFTAVAAALDLVKVRRKYSKIYYIREPIEVGSRSLGFLPGDLEDKYGVYLNGLQDNLEHISEMSGLNINDMKASIECIPPQFIRGRSFENSILLVDEAQDLTLDEIQAISTRLGKFCKLVFLGSLKQIDNKKMTSEKNDFLLSYNILKDLPDEIVGKVDLIKSERSEYCKMLDEAFNNYKSSLQKL